VKTEIRTPEEFRSLLIAAASAVLEGRLTVQQANALAGLSSEVHKSLKMQYVGQMIGAGNVSIQDGRVVRMLEG
jgi:vacuolar-type H+-ATPase subunit E/Vma4